MDRPDVISRLGSESPALRRKFGIASLYLFGSIARGEGRPDSDADILVEFEADARPTLFTLAALASRLEAILGRKVDLVENHAHLKPSFRSAIQRDLCRVA